MSIKQSEEQNPGRKPGHWQQELRELLAKGDNKAALAACEEACKSHPGSKVAFHLLAHAQLKVQAIAPAREALATARHLGLADKAWLKTRLKIARAGQDMAEIRASCIALREQHGDIRVGVLADLARAHMHFRDWEKAKATAEEILKIDGPSVLGVNLKYEALIQIAGPQGMGSALEEWIFGPNGHPEITRILGFLGAHSPEHKNLAKALIQRAFDTWPDSIEVRSSIKKIGLKVNTDGILVDRHDTLSEQRSGLSRFQAIAPLLRDYIGDRKGYSELETVLYQQISEVDLKRKLVTDDPEKDVIQSEAGPAEQVAIVFTGANDQIMMPIEVMDAYLAAAGIGAIYLKDRAKLLYCAGVESLGKDFHETEDGLRQLVHQMGPEKKLTMYGCSGGGVGAIRYGLLLNADRIVNFSGPTNATMEFITRHKDQRARLLVNRLHRAVPDADLVCRDLILSTPNPPPIEMIYGADSPLDRAQSEDIEGLENVELFALSGNVGHLSLPTIMQAGLFPDLVAGNLDGLRAMCDAQGRC